MSWLAYVEMQVTWEEFGALASAGNVDLTGVALLEACRNILTEPELDELVQHHAAGVDVRLCARSTVRQRFVFKEEWK